MKRTPQEFLKLAESEREFVEATLNEARAEEASGDPSAARELDILANVAECKALLCELAAQLAEELEALRSEL